MTHCPLTLVVPVYCCAATIRPTLDAICRQTLRDYELLVIDDGSTDQTGAVLRSYAKREPRLRVITTENRGPAAARNLGLSEARGQYIAFFDGDDLPAPHQLSLLYTAALETGAQVVCCGYRLIQGNRVTVFSPPAANACTAGEVAALLPRLLERQVWFPVWNKLYRTDFLRELGVSFPHWRSGEDRQFNLSLLSGLSRLTCLPDPCYGYLVRPGTSLSVRYLEERLHAALSADVLLQDYAHRHGYSEEAKRVIAGCLIRSAAAQLASLQGPDCPLSGQARKQAIRAVLDSKGVRQAAARCRGCSPTGVLALALSAHSVPLAGLVGTGLSFSRRRLSGLFIHLKKGGAP